MVDQERLLAISNLLDAKLKPLRGEILAFEDRVDRKISQLGNELKELRDEVKELRDEVKELRDEVYRQGEEICSLKAEVGSLKTDVGSLKAEVGNLKTDVGGLKAEVGSLKAEVRSLAARMDAVEFRLSSVEKEVTHLRVVTLEHDMKPRLEHIEECYISVSERYWASTEKIEAAKRTCYNCNGYDIRERKRV